MPVGRASTPCLLVDRANTPCQYAAEQYRDEPSIGLARPVSVGLCSSRLGMGFFFSKPGLDSVSYQARHLCSGLVSVCNPGYFVLNLEISRENLTFRISQKGPSPSHLTDINQFLYFSFSNLINIKYNFINKILIIIL